jgi:hypothetical protein
VEGGESKSGQEYHRAKQKEESRPEKKLKHDILIVPGDGTMLNRLNGLQMRGNEEEWRESEGKRGSEWMGEIGCWILRMIDGTRREVGLQDVYNEAEKE